MPSRHIDHFARNPGTISETYLRLSPAHREVDYYRSTVSGCRGPRSIEGFLLESK